MKVVAKEEGLVGLYGGMGAHLTRVVPNAAIVFLVYESIMSFFEVHINKSLQN